MQEERRKVLHSFRSFAASRVATIDARRQGSSERATRE